MTCMPFSWLRGAASCARQSRCARGLATLARPPPIVSSHMNPVVLRSTSSTVASSPRPSTAQAQPPLSAQDVREAKQTSWADQVGRAQTVPAVASAAQSLGTGDVAKLVAKGALESTLAIPKTIAKRPFASLGIVGGAFGLSLLW